MKLTFTETGWEQYLHWQSHDKAMLKRINRLLKDVLRSPFEGLGKPEPLKGNLSGFWSRRITQEHRLVYSIKDETITVVQCRYHY